MTNDIPVDRDLLRLIAHIDQYRGAWEAGVAIPVPRADQLIAASRASAIAASCRIAGFDLSDADARMVLADPTAPHPHRAEIVQYAAAQTWPAFEGARLDGELLRRMHAVLTGAGDAADVPPSPWREASLVREAFSDGQATGRMFHTLPPRLIEEKVEDLTAWLELELAGRQNHPVLVIAVFKLMLIAISPFEHTNGRLTRLLAGRLLLRSGYAFMAFGSLERTLEQTRSRFLDAYNASETGLWTGEAELKPWLMFFLENLVEVVGSVREAVELEAATLRYTPLQMKVLETLQRHGTADAALLLEATGANRNTLKDNMRRLVGAGVVEKTGERRGTRYRLAPGAGPLRPDA